MVRREKETGNASTLCLLLRTVPVLVHTHGRRGKHQLETSKPAYDVTLEDVNPLTAASALVNLGYSCYNWCMYYAAEEYLKR